MKLNAKNSYLTQYNSNIRNNNIEKNKESKGITYDDNIIKFEEDSNSSNEDSIIKNNKFNQISIQNKIDFHSTTMTNQSQFQSISSKRMKMRVNKKEEPIMNPLVSFQQKKTPIKKDEPPLNLISKNILKKNIEDNNSYPLQLVFKEFFFFI